MSQSQVRHGDYACVFDGQSLVVWPSAYHVNSFPMRMMEGRKAAYHIVGIGGYAWTQLDNDFSSRVAPYAKLAPVSFYIMVGATTQIDLGQAGGAVYNTEKAISDLAYAAGYTYVIGSTTTPSTSFSAADNIELGILNAAVRADASNAFDAVADLAADPRLDDPTDTTYYGDGTHPTYVDDVNSGTVAMAELIGAAVDSLL